jgi:DNA-binding NarL/FixJ family response regulator/predicted Ser/Thr protein kinase
MSSKSPSVLLVEDQQLIRVGLRVSLERLDCCEILGEVANGEDAVKEAQRLRPEIVLMDVGLPGMDGIEATWRIKQEFPRTRVIMFTSRTTPDDVTAALGAGADGYCSKNTPADQIGSAIATVMRGEVWLDPNIADIVSSQTIQDDRVGGALLDVEMQILALVKQGINNREIATRLNITTEKIARVMHNIISRFAEKPTLVDVTQQSPKVCSKEWLKGVLENVHEEKVFADKYVIENLLGSGGIGAVFKAKHLYMDRYVALKLLHPEFSEDRLSIRNFQREAIAIASLQHQNIVSVYDFGISANHEPFLVMEYVNGTTLAHILEKEIRLQVDRLLNLCVQVCAGLAEAESKGIVHCDLKPSNILILGSDPKETVKLADFGLAQIVPREATVQSKLTEKLFICGTPAYMPPEQCAGKQPDARSDIYSLGCIMYEALTGANIFEGETAMGTFAKQFELIPPPMSSTCPVHVSSELEHCVSKMLAKDPANRPQSIEELMVLLHAALEESQLDFSARS